MTTRAKSKSRQLFTRVSSGEPALDQYGNVFGVIQSKPVAYAPGDVPRTVNLAIKSTIALKILKANGVEAPITVRYGEAMNGAEF